ncbi:hypothetical protein L0M81_13440, partial [Alistipes putredinis]|nr:hypothetical protein [Alistipes putredinis]
MAVGLLCIIIAPVFEKIIRFFPKVVTGTVVLVIGVSLLPVGIKWITDSKVGPAEPSQVGLALAVLAITI